MTTGMAQVFSALARQNVYANNVVFQVASKLSLEDLEAARSPSRESAYQLLVHLLAVETNYLAQIWGGGRTINKEAITSLKAVVALATEHNELSWIL